ncbi:MAG: hypothetical protein WB998_05290, partial [Solirubrobacteraceae bacterium]
MGSLPVPAPGRLRDSWPSLGGTPMSLWRRTPRQVYRVYGEEEFLSEEHTAGEAESFAHPEQADSPGRAGSPDETSPQTRGSEIGGPAVGVRSRTPRLVGVGLLLGVVVGVAGLVLSHLAHQAPSARGGASGPVAARPMPPASSGSLAPR